MKGERIIFMGTPHFAVPSLEALWWAGYDIAAVVTQPDAPAGRGQHLVAPPVKQFALAHGLPILQPESLKPPEVVEQLRALQPRVIVVAAFGQILRQHVLDIPPMGCINVHASLLPRWRGASPISAAIAAGDAETGITIMKMDAGLDSGPILSQRAVPIQPDDTTGSLSERLARVGAELLIETLPRWLRGEITPIPHDARLVTLAPRLKKEDGRIAWTRSAAEIARHVRAMSPWPSAFTTWKGRLLKVLRAEAIACPTPAPAGTVVVDAANGVWVACGEGALRLIEVQPEGRPAMSAEAFARGQRDLHLSMLGA